MSNIICTICHELVTERPGALPSSLNAQHQNDTDPDSNTIIGLLCGHIFHKPCVTEWFRKGNENDTDASIKPCPCCQSEVSLEDALRLFPASDLEDKDLEESCQSQALKERDATIKESADIIEKSRHEITMKTAELQNVNNHLEHTEMEVIILRRESAWKTARLQKVQKELEHAKSNAEKWRCESARKATRLQKVQKELEYAKTDADKLKCESARKTARLQKAQKELDKEKKLRSAERRNWETLLGELMTPGNSRRLSKPAEPEGNYCTIV